MYTIVLQIPQETLKQTKYAKMTARHTILTANLQRGPSGLFFFPPSQLTDDDPPYSHANDGYSSLNVDNFRVLAEYYGAQIDESKVWRLLYC